MSNESEAFGTPKNHGSDFSTTLTSEQKLQAHNALAVGTITQKEYDYLLQTEHIGIEKEAQKRRNARQILGISAALVMTVVAMFFLTQGGGLTGLIIAEWNETTFATNEIIDLNMSDVASIRITGTLENGTATINALSGGRSYIVYSGRAVAQRLTTNKASYALNETITIIVDATNYSLWLDNGNKTPINNVVTLGVAGSYTVEAIILDDATKETINIIVRNDTNTSIIVEHPAPLHTFTNVCNESCAMTPNGSVQLEVITDGNITITDISITNQNTAPEQIAQLPTITVNETATINLSLYFTDPDGDSLSYEMNNIIGINETIIGDVLTLSGSIPGTYAATLYVSDLQAITTVAFAITVVGMNEPSITTNQTVNETTTSPTNTTETTTNQTTTNTATNNTNTTQTSTIALTNCNDSDPNKRPLECLQNTTNFFVEQEILLEDIDRRLVGKLTPIGNLLIAGDYVEYSTDTPNDRDWSIGYVGGFGDYTVTIWIDSDTGNLHLRGRLIEANTNIVHSEGQFGLTNKRGILLATANRATGDLTVRGNVIPYRRALG